MINSFDVRRAGRIQLAGSLSILVCLSAIIGSASQEHLPANSAVYPHAEVALELVSDEISVRRGNSLNEAAAEVRTPLVRYLIKELIAERLKAQLSADFEVIGSPDEFAQREAQPTDTPAARAEIKAGLEDQPRVAKKASARGRRRDAAMNDQLRGRDLQFGDVRTEAEGGLPERLDAAHTEPERKGAKNNGLAAKPVAVATNSATVMAPENLFAIENQGRALHGAAGAPPLDRSEPPAEQPSSTLVGALPVMPFPKPGLIGRASAPASDTVSNGARSRAETIPVIEDDASNDASSLKVAVSNRGSATAHGTSTTPDRPEIRHMGSMAALAPVPFASGVVAPNESGVTNGSGGRLEGTDLLGLNEAAARLANGLKVTRKEAISQRQERVFTVDVDQRAFAAASTADPVPLDPAFNIHLFTAKSELIGESRGRIRFFADGSSTGGRIELEVLGNRAAINVQWATGAVTVERL